jgi:hypothetical protein
MLYGANIALCSEKNAKHINTVGHNVKLLILKPFCASHNQQALKG